MSYNAGISGGDTAFALLTGSKSTSNGTPDTVEPAGTSWITLPSGAADGVTFQGAVLMRGLPSSTTQCKGQIGDDGSTDYWEHACLYIPRAGATDNLTGEMSDDEVTFYRSAGATIKLVIISQITGTYYPGISFDSVYPRYCAWRMG